MVDDHDMTNKVIVSLVFQEFFVVAKDIVCKPATTHLQYIYIRTIQRFLV